MSDGKRVGVGLGFGLYWGLLLISLASSFSGDDGFIPALALLALMVTTVVLRKRKPHMALGILFGFLSSLGLAALGFGGCYLLMGFG